MSSNASTVPTKRGLARREGWAWVYLSLKPSVPRTVERFQSPARTVRAPRSPLSSRSAPKTKQVGHTRKHRIPNQPTLSPTAPALLPRSINRSQWPLCHADSPNVQKYLLNRVKTGTLPIVSAMAETRGAQRLNAIRFVETASNPSKSIRELCNRQSSLTPQALFRRRETGRPNAEPTASHPVPASDRPQRPIF